MTSSPLLSMERSLSSSSRDYLQPDDRSPRRPRPCFTLAPKETNGKLHVPTSPNPDDIRSFVTKTAEFKKRRQCSQYVKDVRSQNSFCQCGRDVNWHADNGIPTDTSKEPQGPWTPDEHAQRTWEEPATFGCINFQDFGPKASKNVPYIRLDCKSSKSDDVWKLLSEYWCMPEPKLIISVTGGAQKFTLKDKLKTSLKRGLVNAATATSAWIVTGGSGAGVMAFIGEAIKDHVLAAGGRDQKVVVLGIATWGRVSNKAVLREENNEGRFPAVYAKSQCFGRRAPLDHNHTHFILVDDGTKDKFRGEILFRAELERYISDTLQKRATDTGKHIPVVTLMLAGGVNTIKTALEAVKRNTPVVIIQGSGRAADLIAEALRVKENNDRSFDEFWPDDNLVAALNWKQKKDKTRVHLVKRDGKELLKYTRLITVFVLESGDGLNDLDHAILNALHKAKTYSVKTLLNLSLAWNRCGVAQELFSKKHTNQLQDLDLNEPMFTALVHDQPDFVHLFLDNGVDLEKFLTVRRLCDLYHKVVMSEKPDANDQLLKYLIMNESNWELSTNMHEPVDPRLLEAVGNVIRHLLGNRQENIYKDFLEKGLREYPERELFIWATLLNRKKLALLFWKTGVDHIGGALTASALLEALSKSALKQMELSRDLLSNAECFEDVAMGVLDKCYHQDRAMAHKLLVREQATWEKRTLLDIAHSGERMAFMGHTACQHLLNKIWKGEMALYTSSMRILATVFIPFVIFCIKFTTGGKGSKRNIDDVNKDDEHDNQQQYYEVAVCGNSAKSSIPVASAIYYYFSAPITKFACHTISHVIFLCLFSYFVLSQLHPITEPDSPSGVEILVWVWTATLLVEELRQVWTREEKYIYHKMQGYLHCSWNVLDLSTHFLLTASIVLRLVLSGQEFYWARTCYCITLSLYFIRFMQVFYVNNNIGPKVIMIKQMLTDVVFFLCILVVFLLAFGVTSQALRYPNSKQSWALLKDVVLTPYWQMYGELFLDEVHGDIEECSNNITEWELYPHVPRCPEKSALVAGLLALYMILTNVLLLNLLIAMFSHTFRLVQDNSERVWRFYRYSIVQEYYHRPTLAPPLIIFNHVWRLLKYLGGRCTDDQTSNKLKAVYSRDEAVQLRIFEKAAMERFSSRQQTSQEDQLSVQITSTKDRIIEELDEIKEKVARYPESIWDASDRFLNSPESTTSSSHASIESGIEPLGEQATARLQQLEVKIGNQERRLDTTLEKLESLLMTIRDNQQQQQRESTEKTE